MKPRVTLLTIGVDDLERSLTFYRDGLGWPTKGIVGQEFEHGAVVFFDLHDGLKLALFERKNIVHDAGLDEAVVGHAGHAPAEFTLGHNVASEADVDRIMDEAAHAGARIVKPAQKTFWGGWAGQFQDPDGHLWEIAFNPAFIPSD